MVERAGLSIEVRGLGLCVGVGVGSYGGDGASVVELCKEAPWEETVGVGEGGSSYVREGGSYRVCKGVGSGVGSSGEKTARGPVEGQWGFNRSGPISRHLCSRGLLGLSL